MATDLSDLTPESPGSNNIPFSKGSDWGACTAEDIASSAGAMLKTGGTFDLSGEGGSSLTVAAGSGTSRVFFLEAGADLSIYQFSGTAGVLQLGGSFSKVQINSPLDVDQGFDGDVGWTALTLESGWSNYGSGFQSARYCKRSGVVYVEGLVKKTSGGDDIAYLPAGCRPAADNMIPVVVTSNNIARMTLRSADGAIERSAGDAATFYAINCSFYAG